VINPVTLSMPLITYAACRDEMMALRCLRLHTVRSMVGIVKSFADASCGPGVHTYS